MSRQYKATTPANRNIQISQTYNYTPLINQLLLEQEQLNAKSNKSYWLRYISRRIPLFFSAGLIFYAACLAMTMVKEINLQSINSFLKSLSIYLNSRMTSLVTFTNSHLDNLIPLDINRYHILLTSILLLFSIYVIVCFMARIAQQLIIKALTNTLLFSLSASVFFIVINSDSPLMLGLVVFSTSTITSMLFDRVLGITRRNERYKLFANRAKCLCDLLLNKKIIGIPFDESNLLEIAQFHEELRLSKYKDTVSDSNYLLSIMEKLKGLSK
ncbi:antiviral RADAR system accessory protein RdrD [Plesiomonas shigelloides]|uniref:Uncharacterized protein n=1 Tax=Plesiomonas shigelloides 302-73 TaxID=1315976 RepID=R8AQ24_PLESH|nr:antiviral RADAR system accessory protein RdrD [Plesiomonas shigelloides]EON88424.1 hypothetical protein PLESHI_10675 [Plesiomonas shigelloides 302-73]